MSARDTHVIKNYNSLQLHQGQGLATRVRNTDQGSESPARPTRDDILDEQAELYNRQNRGAPLHDQPERKLGGLSTAVRSQVPSESLIGKDSRSVLKDALANAHGVSRPQDFPAYQPTPGIGVARVSSKPHDTPLFVPKLDPSPKRRLHQLSEDYLQKIWKEDERKDECAQKMETNIASSPIKTLRRGNGAPDDEVEPPLGASGRRHLHSIVDLAPSPEHPKGRAHNPQHLKSNIVLSTDPVAPVLSGRRKIEPSPTKASMY